MSDLDERIRAELHGAADRYDPDAALSLPNVRHRARALRTHMLVYVLSVALVIASGTLVGLGTVRSSQEGSFVDTNPKHQADPNFNIARAETVRLLNLFHPPKGANRVQSAPSPVLARPADYPGFSHFIYTARWWTIPQPFDSVNSWLSSYAPPGFTTEVTGSGGGPNYSDANVDLRDPRTSRAYQDATLKISIVSLGPNATGIRADGSAVWLTSDPARDAYPGSRIRVSVVDGCPDSLGVTIGVSNDPSSDLSKSMLPEEAPVAALRCLYKGSAGTTSTRYQPRLTKSEHLSAADAERLARTINGINLGSPGSFATSCPAMTAGGETYEIIVFSYPGRSDIDLWHAEFCVGRVSNGFITTSNFIPRF